MTRDLRNPAPCHGRYQYGDGQAFWPYELRTRRVSQSAKPGATVPEIPADTNQFAESLLHFSPDPKQREILASPSTRVIVCCSRQWGKSTLGAIRALHHALTVPGAFVLLTSRTLKQAVETLAKVKAFARHVPLSFRRADGHDYSLEFPNHSRIVALSGHPGALRSYTVSLLIVDEAAFVSDAAYRALRPMLATTDGAIWLLSTPNGRRGFFYEEWIAETRKPGGETVPVWTKFTVPATECPRIPKAFLDDERRSLGQAFFEEAYLCRFSAGANSFFAADNLDPSKKPSVLFAEPELAVPPRFFVGFDLGQRQSHSAIIVTELVTVNTGHKDPVYWQPILEKQLHVRKIQRLRLHESFHHMADQLIGVVRSLDVNQPIELIVDATGGGGSFLEILKAKNPGVRIMPVQITSGNRPGYQDGYHLVPKADLMQGLSVLIAANLVRVQSDVSERDVLVREIESIRATKTDNGNLRFQTGTTDDCVMALTLAAWRAKRFLLS